MTRGTPEVRCDKRKPKEGRQNHRYHSYFYTKQLSVEPYTSIPIHSKEHHTKYNCHGAVLNNTDYVWTRAVEPDFKKFNKKSDAQGDCRRLYPTCV